MLKRFLPIVFADIPAIAGPMLFNSAAFDTSQFQVTQYATAMFPLSMLNLGDGSIAIGTYAGILRYTAPGFLGFYGKGSTGVSNEENAVGYYDFISGSYIHFVENSQDGVYSPIGIMSTANALYIADFEGGLVYQITATPELGNLVLLLTGLAAMALARNHAIGGSARDKRLNILSPEKFASSPKATREQSHWWMR